MLSKRERVIRTINFQETDKIPIYDIINNDKIREYFSRQKIEPGNAWELEYTALRKTVDMTRMINIPNFTLGRYTDKDGFVYYRDKYTEWIEKRPFEDVNGLKDWIKKNISYKKKWQADDSYIEQYRKNILNHKKGIGDETVIVVESNVGLDYAYNMAGIELFSYLMVDEPAIISEWLEVLNQAEIRRAKAIADPELVPVMLTYSDLAYKTGLIFPPDFLRREFFPRLKKLNNTYQNVGVKCLFHSDGDLNSILDDLIAADIDGINPMETLAGMDIKKVRGKYGHKIFITGGIDVSQLMTYGTPEEVECTCKQAIIDTDGVGYFLGSTTELHNNVKTENILAMIKVASNFKP
jgi:hypothetical protein